MTRRSSLALAVLCATVLFNTACSPSEDSNAEAPATEPAATSSAVASHPPTPESTLTPTPVPELTCDGLIPESLIEEFSTTNWTARADVFRIGSTELPDGIGCTWADYDAPASDNLLIFGWAPISDQLANTAQAELIANGWLREDLGDTILITEDPQYAIATDSEGYGLSYEFGDGWVKFATNKQGLILIEWPPA